MLKTKKKKMHIVSICEMFTTKTNLEYQWQSSNQTSCNNEPTNISTNGPTLNNMNMHKILFIYFALI